MSTENGKHPWVSDGPGLRFTADAVEELLHIGADGTLEPTTDAMLRRLVELWGPAGGMHSAAAVALAGEVLRLRGALAKAEREREQWKAMACAVERPAVVHTYLSGSAAASGACGHGFIGACALCEASKRRHPAT